MPRLPLLPSLLAYSMAGACLLPALVHAQFTTGRPAVLEMPFIPNGGGGYSIPTTGGALVIHEFTSTGASGFIANVPSSGPDMLVGHFQIAGVALSLSPAGDKLVFTGYTATSTGANIHTTSAAEVPRAIGTMDATGGFQRLFSGTGFFDTKAIVSATTDGTNYWAGGAGNGVCYMGPGASAVIATTKPNCNELKFNSVLGLLDAAPGPDSPTGLFQVGSGSPTTATTMQLLIPANLQGFQVSPDGTVIYGAFGNQVKKWVFSGGVWTQPYAFNAPASISRVAVDFSSPQPVIYTVAVFPAALYRFVDTGAPSTSTTLATSSTSAFMGVALTPVSNCVEGSPCDDHDPNTIQDAIRADCQCGGNSIALAAKVFLEGPYNSGTGLMNDALRTLPDFPLSEPFTALGLNPSGGAGTINASVLSVSGNNGIVDWVLVELRDAITPSAVLLRTPALVQRDGDIVALNGTGTLQLPAEPNTYRVAVRHRNHLGAMTDAALSLSNAPTPIDFTSAATIAWGTDARKDANGVQLLWSGETVRNGQLTYTGSGNDRDPILVTVGSTTPNSTVSGYRSQDVNMNGITAYTGSGNDRDPILVNVGSTTPNNVRVEQLP
jgi:hypothetical protein